MPSKNVPIEIVRRRNREASKRWRERHPEQRREINTNSFRSLRSRLRLYKFEYLKKHPCVDCGEKDPIVLDFDHREGEPKVANISDLANGSSLKLLIEEMNKCDIRCANCHRRATHARRALKKFAVEHNHQPSLRRTTGFETTQLQLLLIK